MLNSGKLLVSGNTTYTGLTGLHSEVSQAAHARATVYDRRSSDAVNVEQMIHMKELQSLNSSKKLIQKSMLAYSEKMRAITCKREQTALQNGKAARKPSPPTRSTTILTDKAFEVTPDPDHKLNISTLQNSDTSRYQDTTSICRVYDLHASKHHELTVDSQDIRQRSSEDLSRASVDSGFGSDIVSDGYLSDTESTPNSFRTYVRDYSPAPARKSSAGSEKSVTSVQSDSVLTESRARARRRERRRRLGVRNRLELPTVVDTESIQETDEPCTSEPTISISSFPEYLDPNKSEHDVDTISVNSKEKDDVSRVTDTLQNPTYWTYRVSVSPRPNKAPSGPMTRPKVTSSPSVASIRTRKLLKKKRSPGKKVTKSFRYSDHIGGQVTPQSSSNERSDSFVDSMYDSMAWGDSETMRQQLKLRLTDLEDSSIQESVLEADDEDFDWVNVTACSGQGTLFEFEHTSLKSALKNSQNMSSQRFRRKKNVHFFLPDIIEKPSGPQ